MKLLPRLKKKREKNITNIPNSLYPTLPVASLTSYMLNKVVIEEKVKSEGKLFY